jgi:hypothetical protein
MKRTMLYLPAATLLLAFGSARIAVARHPAETKPAPEATVGKSALGAAETISGSLYMLVKDQKLVVVQGVGRVIYNFKVTATTKIKVGEKEATFGDLSALANKRASITFVPMREGNVANKIEIEP